MSKQLCEKMSKIYLLITRGWEGRGFEESEGFCTNTFRSDGKRANQKQFKAMLVMQYDCQGLGRVKLLVGIRHKTMLKVQYCITALEVE